MQGNFKITQLLRVSIGFACCSYAFAKDECVALLSGPVPTIHRAAEHFSYTFYYLKFQNHVNQLGHMFDRWMESHNAEAFPNEKEFYARAFGIYSELLDVSVHLFPHKKFPMGSWVTLEDGNHSIKFPEANLSKLAMGFIKEFRLFRDQYSMTQFIDRAELYRAMRNSGKLELHLMGALLFAPEKILIREADLEFQP